MRSEKPVSGFHHLIACSILFALLSLAFAWSQTAYASEFGVGVYGSYVRWEEGGGDVDERSLRGGVYADLVTGLPFGLGLNLRGEAYAGQSDYDGQYWSGQPVSGTGDHSGWRIRVSLERGVNLGAMRLAAFIGAEFERWRRDLSDEPGGYEEVWITRTLLAGFRVVGRAFSLGRLGFEVFYGEGDTDLEARLSEVAPGSGNADLEPDGPRCWGAELFWKVGFFEASVFWRAREWSASDGETVFVGGMPVEIWQPKSREEAVGVRIGMRF
ncbi:hypothetical protein [Thermosulfurimonas sp. F29]|uniref:hypothetical protein n=1 Tax=Thermosulfurimonas sp. F29 TaxID=2867247 RepID=UPI001C839ABB|nr:hypothetical protein [Thermosulfurimonas sp. F29]MBX6424197.1 hypothetical protein [Thermosulfurimonas sp. F29]